MSGLGIQRVFHRPVNVCAGQPKIAEIPNALYSGFEFRGNPREDRRQIVTKVRDIDQLVQAARKVFAEKGFDQARIEDIAGELGLLKGSLYYHVASKNELLYLVVRQEITPWLESVEPIVSSDAPARERMRLAIQQHMRNLQAHAASRLLFDEALNALQPKQHEEISRLYDQYTYLFVRVLKDGIASGEFRQDLQVRVASLAVVGMMNWSQRWFREHGAVSIDEVAATFSAMVLDGLGCGRAD